MKYTIYKCFRDSWCKLLRSGEIISDHRSYGHRTNEPQGCALCVLANASQVGGYCSQWRLYTGNTLSDVSYEGDEHRKMLGTNLETLRKVEEVYTAFHKEDSSTAFDRTACWVEEHIATEIDPTDPPPIGRLAERRWIEEHTLKSYYVCDL